MDMRRFDLQQILVTLGPKFAERAADHDETDRFVAENYADLKEARVFSALVPHEFGGSGQSIREMAAFLRGLAPYCASTALALSMHQHLVGAAAWNYRNGNPGAKLLEKVGAGENVCVSTGANDWLSSNGEAKPIEGGFEVTAKKPFGSGSPAGDIVVTSAACHDAPDGPEVIHFPVPLSAEGVSILSDWQVHGMRGTGSNTIVFDKVFVPEDAVAVRRPLGRYHPVWNPIISIAMTLISSVYVGIADAAFDIVRRSAESRPFDTLGQVMMGELGNLRATADMAYESMVGITGDWDFPSDLEVANTILTRKTIAVQAAEATVRKALEISGGGGFFRKHPLERLLRDVTAGQFHPLPEKKQNLFSGRVLLGLEPAAPSA